MHLISSDFLFTLKSSPRLWEAFFYSSTCSSVPPDSSPAPHTHKSLILRQLWWISVRPHVPSFMLSILLNIYNGSQAEIKVLQIQSQLKIAPPFLARQSGINQSHRKDAKEERRGADNLFIQFFFFFQLFPSVINKLAGQTAWDATQMFSGFPLLKIAVTSGFFW